MNYLIRVENGQGRVIEQKACRYISDCLLYCNELAKQISDQQVLVKLFNPDSELIRIYSVHTRTAQTHKEQETIWRNLVESVEYARAS